MLHFQQQNAKTSLPLAVFQVTFSSVL